MSDPTRFDAPRAPKPVPNGFYTGRIKCDTGPIVTNPSYRDAFVKGKWVLYLDLSVVIDQMPDAVVTVGYSSGELDRPRNQGGHVIKNPVSTSELGKLLGYWTQMNPNSTISVTEVLNGKEIAFMVKNEPGAKNPAVMYPKIVKQSVVPKGQGQNPAAFGQMPPSSPPAMPQQSQGFGQPGQYPGGFPQQPQA